MKLAHGKADYLLLLDADMTVSSPSRCPLSPPTPTCCARATSAANTATSDWCVATCTGATSARRTSTSSALTPSESVEHLDSLLIEHHRRTGAAGSTSSSAIAELLEAELRARPDNTRTVFYLAQTYRDIGTLSDDDATLGSRSSTTGVARRWVAGWRRRTSLVTRSASSAPDWATGPGPSTRSCRAWEQRPARLEAVHALAVGLRERGLHRAAHQFTRLAAGLRPLPVPEDILFVAPWIYEWGMLFEYSITAYWCGESSASILACKRLLAIDSLPAPHRRQTRANLQARSPREGASGGCAAAPATA